jgi:hypothetical protein
MEAKEQLRSWGRMTDAILAERETLLTEIEVGDGEFATINMLCLYRDACKATSREMAIDPDALIDRINDNSWDVSTTHEIDVSEMSTRHNREPRFPRTHWTDIKMSDFSDLTTFSAESYISYRNERDEETQELIIKLLTEWRTTGAISQWFLAHEPGQDKESASTWGPKIEDVDWTDFPS